MNVLVIILIWYDVGVIYFGGRNEFGSFVVRIDIFVFCCGVCDRIYYFSNEVFVSCFGVMCNR